MKSRASAFSLLELLLVISIIAVLMTLATPAFNSISRGRKMDLAGASIADQIALARQVSISRNRAMEVRFYKFTPALPGSTAGYRALQVIELQDDGGEKPVGRPVKLPDQIIVSEDAAWSSLFAPGAAVDLPGTNVAGLGAVSAIKSFQFRAGGRTSLPDINSNYFVSAFSELPGQTNNFATVQVDPFNGRVRLLRP
jgi:uncharacterized protein (TIGR02596 family)